MSAAAQSPATRGLIVSNLRKAFGGVHAVDGVSFELPPGRLLALIGPNGAGKTTCFNLLNGQLEADSGSVRFNDIELVGLSPHQIWHHGIGRTFQITATFATMTVRENVQMALMSRRGLLYSLVRRASKIFVEEANNLLERVGIAEHAQRPCGVLAYGDLKRVELCVALANDPSLLLMDEPTAGMAASERHSLMALVTDIVTRDRISVLFTEHDMDTVFGHAEHVLVLAAGKLIADGTPDEVRNDAEVKAIYLGSDKL
ncbi:MAG: ABC transporter ATP-binding protein [Gammaproteobacteria bacterium]